MTKDKIIEALEACRRLEIGTAHIEQKLDMFLRRRALFCTGKPLLYDENCKNKDCIKLCERIDSLRDELKQKISESLTIKAKCELMLDLIPNESERELMRLYFVDGKTWDRISGILHYSMSYIMKHRHAAINALAEALAGKEKEERKEPNGNND